jgi:hypothetical protein
MVFGKPVDELESARPVLSKQNSQPLSAILIIHAAFLTAVICPICWAFHQLSSFDFDPDPIDIQSGNGSYNLVPLLLGFLFIFGLILLRQIERRWIYADSGPVSSKSGSVLVENETTEGQ